MKRKFVKGLTLTAFMFSMLVVGLAFTPHITFGCGKYEDGSQLTHFINSVSETIVGKPIIEKNPRPGL